MGRPRTEGVKARSPHRLELGPGRHPQPGQVDRRRARALRRTSTGRGPGRRGGPAAGRAAGRGGQFGGRGQPHGPAPRRGPNCCATAARACVKDRTAAQHRLGQVALGLLRTEHRRRLDQAKRQVKAVDAAVREALAADPALARKARCWLDPRHLPGHRRLPDRRAPRARLPQPQGRRLPRGLARLRQPVRRPRRQAEHPRRPRPATVGAARPRRQAQPRPQGQVRGRAAGGALGEAGAGR